MSKESQEKEVRDLLTRFFDRTISRREFLTRAAALGAAVPVMSGLLPGMDGGPAQMPGAASVAGRTTGAEEQVLRFPFFEPTSPLDPGLTSDFTVGITTQLFNGLTSYTKPGELREAASYKISEDGLTYTFTLRDDLKWSDGTPITAFDYEYSWKRVIDPKTGAYYAFVMHHIENAKAVNTGESDDLDSVGVKALDERTLQIRLDQPAGYLLPLLAVWSFYPVPKAKIEAHGDKWIEAENIICNGPFMMESWEHDQLMVLVPNPEYSGEKPKLSRLELVLLEDHTSMALPAYENDEMDYAMVPIAEIDRIRKDPVMSQELHFGKKLRPVFINFDCSHAPWDDVRVRQAFALAVNRDEIVNSIFKGAYKPIKTLIPEPILGWTEDVALPGGVEEAQALLAEAGFPGGEGFPEFTFIGPNDERHRLLAPALQAQWQNNLGITSMKIQLLEHKAYWEANTSHKNQPFDMLSGGWTADYIDPVNYFNDLWHSKAQYWNNRWANAEFDALIEEAAMESDQEKRREMYEQANAILARELPAVPLWHDGWAYVVKPYVKGLRFATSNTDPVWNEVYLEK